MASTDPQIMTTFVDCELRLATYYVNLRDKIAALNIAVLGFTFTILIRFRTLNPSIFPF